MVIGCKQLLHATVLLIVLLPIYALSNSLALSSVRHQQILEQAVVHFNPVVELSPGGETCQGLLYSSYQLVTPSACVFAAKRLMTYSSVQVINYEGVVVGQLSGAGNTDLSAVSELDMLLPYTPVLDDSLTEGSYPELVQSMPDTALDGYILHYQSNRGEPPEWLRVRVSRSAEQPSYYHLSLLTDNVIASEDSNLASRLVGSPVLNRQGQVLCLTTTDGLCQKLSTYGGDDGSCQVHYFHCENVTWQSCSNGLGSGSGVCFRGNESLSALLTTYPDNSDVNNGECSDEEIVNCRNSDGCGCIQAESCGASWGFCELTFEPMTLPMNCLTGPLPKPLDPRCAHLPHSSGHSSGFWAKVVGIPVVAAVLIVTSAAVVIGCICYRRMGYERIDH